MDDIQDQSCSQGRVQMHKVRRARPPIPEDHLFVVGLNLLKAARVLHEHIQKSGQDWLLSSLYLQIGFSVELLQKFYLATAGCSEKEIVGFNHRLGDAYTECVKRGLTFASMDAFGKIVEKLNTAHKDLVFRYMPQGTFTVPAPPESVLAVLDQLAEALRPRLTQTWTKTEGPVISWV